MGIQKKESPKKVEKKVSKKVAPKKVVKGKAKPKVESVKRPKSKSGKTIKEFVKGLLEKSKGEIEYEKMEKEVLKKENFPTSKFQKSHYAWYKSKYNKGEL